mmetsp:Transcript_6222/g.15397  ORF Transcript_6222/g.15397 Transcript_6222/m.15397 type:complete len:645 (-) Transcript_6222:57-1991(-)
MGRDHRRRSQTKRRFRQVKSTEENSLETVDDLAHAAQFAIFPAAAAATVAVAERGNPTKADDDNEIEVEDNDSANASDASIPDAMPNEPQNDDDVQLNDADSESSDGESDVDLAEALQKMEEAATEGQENLTATAAPNPPKTENEVDGYKASIQELESQLKIQLTVKSATNTAGMNDNMDITINDVSPAGNIKNHMVLDRTVVVQSILRSPASHQGVSGPLDEGSLLVIQISDNDNAKNASGAIWIPLGRIFEVFGPVSQPLYTIRLPTPLFNGKKQPPVTRSNPETKPVAKCHERKEVESEEVEADVCGEEEDTERNEKEGKNGTVSNNEIGRQAISSSEQVHEAEEKDENIGQCLTTIKETSNVPEDEGLSSTIPMTSSSDNKEKSQAVESEVKNKNPITDETEENIIDPWAIDGEYTLFLSQNKDVQVYYVQDEAKLIDTGLVLRTSGKGCDASNKYDEEILDSSEAYYSDDEKEREAKNKKKGGTRKKTLLRNNHQRQQIDHRPRERHGQQQQLQYNNSPRFTNAMVAAQQGRSTIPPPPPPQYFGYGQHHGTLPQGFHRTTDQIKPQGGFQQPPVLYQYPKESSFHRHASIPPPPPPPPRPHQPQPYQGTTPPPYPLQGASSVPPPPPQKSNEPPNYQY